MTYKCNDCGCVFDKAETYTEHIGDYWGAPAYQEFDVCPSCGGGDIEETTPCEICGEEHLDHELFGGVCNDCINAYRKDFNTCYNISIGETEEIKINALLASLFEPCDIEQILKEHIIEKMQTVDCSEFIDSDMDWFGEALAKEVNKNEKSKN